MSATPNHDAPPPAEERSPSLLRWIAGSTAVVATLAAVTIAVWPASETDKAREDGERFGEAVAQLQAADTSAEVDAALIDVRDALADTREHAGDEVTEQVAEQEDALARAADGFVGMHSSDDEFDQELYEYELDVAVDDLTSQAEDFRTQGPEVAQAFWDGYETGLAA